LPPVCLDDLRLNHREQDNPKGSAVVFAHALGTDLGLWDKVLPLLPQALRQICLDMRGHGRSDTPPPFTMGTLIRGAGHMPPVDRPDAFAIAVDDFLAEIAHA
jgi:3-oxoadipate enol-lactonase